MFRCGVKFKDRLRSFPRPGNRDGTVADHLLADVELVRLGPALAGMERVVDDLAVHLLPVMLAPREDFPDGHGGGRELHEES